MTRQSDLMRPAEPTPVTLSNMHIGTNHEPTFQVVGGRFGLLVAPSRLHRLVSRLAPGKPQSLFDTAIFEKSWPNELAKRPNLPPTTV